MAAEITYPLTADHLRKRAIALRAYIDQAGADPDFAMEDEESILTRVLTDEELEWIEEHEETLFTALQRIDDDFNRVVDASIALHASQDAVDAHVVVIAVEEDADQEASDEDARGDDDPDGDVEEED